MLVWVYTCLSESTHVKLLHCWKSHVMSHIIIVCLIDTTGASNRLALGILTLSMLD